jgi:hypothetical protein
MASAAHGSTRSVRWHNSNAHARVDAFVPLFAANDNGEAQYRAVHDAARRLWRDHGFDAPQIAANRAQSAFWQGRMDACRWWHSVARMLDRALVAGSHPLYDIAEPDERDDARQVPVNS